MPADLTPVLRFYEGKSIFLTGGTGFVGKCVLEKIMRTLPCVACVYVLVRTKDGARPPADRLNEEVLQSEVWTRLRRERPDTQALLESKIVPIAGDILADGLGLSEADAATLRARVDVVIHCAATISFTERLDIAMNLNVHGTLRLLELAKGWPRCASFVHVSTAYVNSNKPNGARVEERVYPLDFDVEAVMARVRSIPDADMERATLEILGQFPNTYTLTKAMTEVLVMRRRGHMPVCILRPSIIGCAWQDPVPGWVDVVSAAGAVYIAVGFGVLTILAGNPRGLADVVPVDFCVNQILLSAYDIAGKNELVVSARGATLAARGHLVHYLRVCLCRATLLARPRTGVRSAPAHTWPRVRALPAGCAQHDEHVGEPGELAHGGRHCTVVGEEPAAGRPHEEAHVLDDQEPAAVPAHVVLQVCRACACARVRAPQP